MKFKFRNLFIIIFSCFILLSCLSGYNGNLKKVSLNRVIDGDTIKVSIDGKLENVRLLLIDAPELRGSYPYSSEARKFLERRLSDDEYVKRYARGKYMMSKPGEQVFVLPPKNTEKSSDE